MNSPVKSASKHINRSLSLDLSSVVEGIDYAHKRKESQRLILQTRLCKGELQRLHWDDRRETKHTIEAERRDTEVNELQRTHEAELEYKQRRAKEKQRESLKYRRWLKEQAQDNRSVKQLKKSIDTLEKRDDLSRTQSNSIFNRQIKSSLRHKARQAAEEQRKAFQEQIEAECRARDQRAKEEMSELKGYAKRRIDELFEQALQENRKCLSELMTAKYSRRPV
jgi:hypothetical protein